MPCSVHRRRASQVSTISEGSEGSTVSEIDDGVWKITEEQRTYYVKQFKKLQPNEKGLIKGRRRQIKICLRFLRGKCCALRGLDSQRV